MTQEDSVQRLAEIRERAEKTTPGPWFFGFRGFEGHAGSVMATWPNGDGGGPIVGDVTLEGDADFICHSREDVPYLLALIDSITAERDRLMAAGCPRCGHVIRNEGNNTVDSVDAWEGGGTDEHPLRGVS